MLVIEKKCTVCRAVKVNKQLLQRIYESSWFVPHSKDTLKDIAKQNNLPYQAILNHVKKHQFIDSADYQEAMLNSAVTKAEKGAIAKAVRATGAIQSIMDKGQERLDNGEITVNTDQLLRAAQIKLADESKKKDQDLMALSLAHFISGESQNERVYVDVETNTSQPTESN
jgi:hypothetical protein